MVGFVVWFFEACFILFRFWKEESWLSLTLSNPTEHSKTDSWWCESRQVQTPWHHSCIWGIFHLRGNHFPTVETKKLTSHASLAARPHPCDPSSACQMFFHKALSPRKVSHMRKPTRPNPFPTKGGDGGVHCQGNSSMSWAVGSRLEAAAGALCWYVMGCRAGVPEHSKAYIP